MAQISPDATMTVPSPVKEYPVKIYEKVRQNKLLAFGAVIAAYLVLTVVTTWPILPNFGSQLFDTGDPIFIAWVVGTEISSITTGDFANFWNQPIFYPYPNTLALSDHSLTLTLQGLPTYLITNNPIATANSLVLTGFFLSALFAYFLVLHYTGSRKAAFFGGLVFGFSTYHVAHLDHLQFINYQYIPLALLFFEKLLKTPNWKNAVFFALAFTLNAFISVYLLGFVLIPLALILFIRLLARQIKFTRGFVLNFLLAAFLSVVLVGPWLLPYLEIGRLFNVYHGAEEYYGYSAHVGDFLLTAKSNWLMGGFTSEVIANNPGSYWKNGTVYMLNSWNERTVYLGFITLAIALWGVVARNPGKKKIQITPNGAIWLLIAVVSVIFALGPILAYNQASNTYTIGPYAILSQVLPIYKGIRVPSRFIVVVVLAVAVLIGFAVKKLEDFGPRWRLAGYAAFAFILVVEQGSVPLQLQTPLPINNALYQYTSTTLPKEAVLAHYPFQNTDLSINYLRGALLDRHRTLNGYSSFTPGSILELENLSSTDPNAFLKISATLGINYLVVHGDYINSGDPLQAVLKEKKFVPMAAFGNDSVYDISAEKDDTLYKVVPTSTNALENGRLGVDTKNDSSTIFVSPQLEKFNLKITYFKGGNKVGENNLSYYKPLFLLPGEVSSASVEISPPLLGFDDYTVDIK